MYFLRKIKLLTCFVLVMMIVSTTTAQESTCPAVIEEATSRISELCNATGRNQACYGNLQVIAEPQADVTDFVFESAGDIVDVIDIASLKVSAFDPTNESWGVSIMKLQANLPDTVPGQNAIVLLFGDSEIYAAAEEAAPTINISANGGLNVRSGPGTNYAIITALTSGDTVTADGRNADSSWLRLQLEDGRIGWVFAQLVEPESTTDTLMVRTADDTSGSLRPMQAFYFRGGVGSAACAGHIETGMVIQTPKGVGQITLTINEVRVSIASVVYFQTTEDQQLSISTLEGEVEVEAFGVTQTVPAGEQVTVPLDAELAASGPPSEPQPQTDTQLLTLPLNALPEPIEKITLAIPAAGPEATEVPSSGSGSGGNADAPLPTGSGTAPSGEAISIVGCSFGDGVSLAAGQPLILRYSWVTAPGYLSEYMAAVKHTLTVDGQEYAVNAVTTSSISDPPSQRANYYWTIPDLGAGAHEVIITETLSSYITDGLDTDEDGKLDYFGGSTAFSCTVTLS